jgi:hypothetical protein
MHVLRDAVRGSGLYEGAAANPIAWIEGSDICVYCRQFLPCSTSRQ